MNTYRLTPEFFQKLERRGLWVTIAVPILIAVFQILFDGGITVSGICMAAVLGSITVVFSRRMNRQQHRSWASYRITLNEDSITKSQEGFKDVTFSRDDVRKTMELPDQLLIVQGNHSQHIDIPTTLEGYETVREVLSQWQAIEVKSNAKQWRNLFLFGCSPFILVAIILRFSGNKYLMAGSLILLTIYLAFGVIYNIIAEKESGKRKKRMWMSVIASFPVFYSLIYVILKILGL